MGTARQARKTPKARPGAAARPVRMQDVADRCGVSVMTVSLALRDSGGISGETRDRVLAAASELGYDPHCSQVARRLRSLRNGRRPLNRVIGFCFSLHYLDAQYFTELLRGLGEAAEDAGFSLLIQQPDALSRRGTPLPPVIARGDVDGFLFLSGIQDMDRALRALRRDPGFGSRPIVVMMEPHSGSSAVMPDDEHGGYLAAQHLLELGHRELFVIPQGAYPHVRRLAGCRRALAERGLDPDACMHALDRDIIIKQRDSAALRHALAAHPRCRACFAGNDHAAVALAHLALHGGLSIPHDVSLVGYDDTISLPGVDGQNCLTSVRVPLQAIGRTAAQLLLAQIRNTVAPAENRCLPVELIVRGSTAAPPPRGVPA